MNGNQLDAIREAMSVKKKDLAIALNISRPTLDVRLGDPSLFTLGQVEILCRILKIDKSAILPN